MIKEKNNRSKSEIIRIWINYTINDIIQISIESCTTKNINIFKRERDQLLIKLHSDIYYYLYFFKILGFDMLLVIKN